MKKRGIKRQVHGIPPGQMSNTQRELVINTTDAQVEHWLKQQADAKLETPPMKKAKAKAKKVVSKSHSKTKIDAKGKAKSISKKK